MNDGRDDKPRSDKPNRNPRFPGGPVKGGKNAYSLIVFVMMAVMLLMMLMNYSQRAELISISEFEQRVKNGDVEKVTVGDNELEGVMREGAQEGKDEKASAHFKVALISGVGKEAWFRDLLAEHGVPWEYKEYSALYELLSGMIMEEYASG